LGHPGPIELCSLIEMETKMTARAQLLLLATLCAAPAAQLPDVPEWQSAAGGKMAFEVASVKPSKGAFTPPVFPLDSGDAYTPTGGRFKADFPVWVYIQFAYKISPTDDQRIFMLAHLPKWVASDRFSIEARAEGNPTKDQMRLMMQSLLADRFQLAVHFETHDTPVLGLALIKPGKTGPNLRLHADGPPCDTPIAGAAQIFPPRCDVFAMILKPGGTRMLGSRNITIDQVAGSLSTPGRLGRPVVDQTGLTGRFDFTIEWVPEPNGPPPPSGAAAPADPSGPSFQEALHDQLGLKLEAARAPVRTLVIDKVERPSEN
jgi:bla regulator protein BlaR1